MNTSDGMIELIKGFESFVDHPYKCPAGVWTIGYGHTGTDTNGAGWRDEYGEVHYHITRGQATELLRKDLAQYELYVNRANEALKAARGGTYGFHQRQFDALVSFTYNCGAGSFVRSTLRRVAIDPHSTDKAVVKQLMRWTRAAGKVLNGLVKRRAVESAWWVYGSRWNEEIGTEKKAMAWAKEFAGT